MEENFSKGIFGLSKKDVEAYISNIKKDYEEELLEQTKQLKEMKAENEKLNERLNTLLNEKKEVEMAKQNISDVLVRAELQAKQIIDSAREQAEKEKHDLDLSIELQKEKLIDARLELAMLKDKAKELMMKFSEDITNI